MSVEQVLFYVFGAIAVASALAVITLRNVVHSAGSSGMYWPRNPTACTG